MIRICNTAALLLPVLGCAGAVGVLTFARHTLFAFISSSAGCLAVILTAGVALFPSVLPSSSTPAASPTAWDAVSSHTTLSVMLWVALIFTPIVLAYNGWAYRVMAGKVSRQFIVDNDKSLY